MLAACPDPIWRVDDLTPCFQRTYLQIVLPLVVCALSLLYILTGLLRGIARERRIAGYQTIPDGHDVPDASLHRQQGLNSEGNGDVDGEDESNDGPHLALQRTITRTNEPIVDLDRPRGEVTLVVIEQAAVIGQTAIHLAAILTHAGGRHGQTAESAGLVVWLYILLLSTSRLLLSTSKRFSYPVLWNHTAFLYGFQWLFTVLRFRSNIIHPRSRLAQIFVVVDFALVTLLGAIAATTRMGNRTVLLEHEPGLEPSREPIASLFSLATFGWVDPIVWKGYKKTYELSDVWDLIPEDKAVAHFRRMFLLQAAWSVLGSLFTFAPTLLLKAILEYIEQPETIPQNAAWFYVILLFIVSCMVALGDGHALFLGRRICIRLRAVVIGEVYAKALRRKAAAGNDTILGTDKGKSRGNGIFAKIKNLGRKKKNSDATPQKALSDTQVNVGTIINLMAVDSFKVSEVTAYFHFLTASVPVQIIVAITLLYRILGYSSIAGIVVMVILLPINIVIARGFSEYEKRIMAATDARIHTTNEVLQNIRIIKFFAWEHRFGHVVNEKRSTELKSLRNKFILWAAASTVWYGAPLLITFLSFLIYTVVEGKDLIPSVAFTALSLFSLLRVPLDQFADMLAHVQESKVSVDRVEEFLNEDETEKYDQIQQEREDETGEVIIGLDGATCTWGRRIYQDIDGPAAFSLLNMNVRFHVGQLNIIAGPTGSGKTSLLMALLGEMTLTEGTVYLPGGLSREDLRPDRETGLTESVAYCAQQAWLVNDTVKQNILFASPFDQKRYQDVISACALTRDLEILDAGDDTLVGEKGITLSGGQKQRISLARALYSNSRHVLLDDCLSAVDSHTAKWIFDHCILGPLMYGRTCILVTHNVSLAVPHAQHVVVLDNGKIALQGNSEHVMTSGSLGDDLQRSAQGSKAGSKMSSRVPSEGEQLNKMHETNGNGASKVANGELNGNIAKPSSTDTPQDSNARTEGKAEGSVNWRVMRLFVAAMGSWFYWIATLGIFAAQQVGSLGTNVWIRQWANSYHTSRVRDSTMSAASSSVHRATSNGKLYVSGCLRSGTCLWNLPSTFLGTSETLESASSSNSEVDVAYYLGVYALIAILYLIVSFLREGTLFYGSLNASRRIHERLLESVTRAKFRFFDSTPLGQMMNRFSKDIETVDQSVAPVALGLMDCLASVIMVVILISIITPQFLFAGIFIGIMYFALGMFYINSSRDLKRLESIQRSPLYQQFGETLSGITTIRAYGDERRFIRENLHRVNTHNRPFIYLWGTNRWLGLRVDVVGAFVSFFAGAFVILNVKTIDPGAAGLSLTYAITFNENVLWLVRLYAVNEQNLNSVERIKEYLDVEQEAKPVIPETQPAANWPSKGTVQFINYSTRYRTGLDPVLRNVSFKINALEKVGIVGRTGAGKSSLALALFRGLEADEGKIVIDDVDIALIGLQDLRESITIVPQDPTLFTGTIRSNLDPFGLFTDEGIFTALHRVQLIGPATPDTRPSTPTTPVSASEPSNKNIFQNLSSPVTESGNNLSQGQKQLLCLARAMLKDPKVLLMDEATASIDYNTDAKIQTTIRELKGTTITIAHRLQTIIDYDKVLVLDMGEVKEYDHPWTLLQKEDSLFRGMCEMSGEAETLREGARKAWESKRLVDVDG
ncbi:MAG: hypothetical protein M1833_000031 [Piccolia ochrophora]|nr:MAG: hypothetical protein M1833_000031 [Piccolia ochrophora]